MILLISFYFSARGRVTNNSQKRAKTAKKRKLGDGQKLGEGQERSEGQKPGEGQIEEGEECFWIYTVTCMEGQWGGIVCL